MARDIDSKRPALTPLCLPKRTYASREKAHTASEVILHNEQYNNQARIINRQRCQNLDTGKVHYRQPPHGLIRMIRLIEGKAHPLAPYRMKGLSGVSPAVWDEIGKYYGFPWNINLGPDVARLPPYTTMADVYTDYKLFMGAL